MANEAEAGKQLAADNEAALSKYKALVTTTTTPPPPTTANPSGEAMPVGDIKRTDGSVLWKHAFADDFNQDAAIGSFPDVYKTKWGFYPYPWPDTWTKERDRNRKGFYDPRRVLSAHNSKMRYFLHTEAGERLIAAPLPKLVPGGTGYEGFKYMRIAIRMRSDALYGYKTAFLTWPTSGNWPWEGELDFVEGNLDGKSTMSGFHHRMNGTKPDDQDPRGYGVTPGDWHTYILDWNENYCAFLVDGKIAGTPITARVPNVPHRIVLQAETNLDGTQQPADSTKGYVEVDWISVWLRP